MILALTIAGALDIVPAPRSEQLLGGTYLLRRHVEIAAASPDERNVARFAARFLLRRGITATIVPSAAGAQIRLRSNAHDAALAAEGYRLRVDPSGITIDANDGAGLYYGLQTLEQIVPRSGAPLPQVAITDWPRFSWRGLHLDVSRHFFGVPVVERYIDLAAHYKFNRFHWHLTDDQGWRIQIKRYPRLTSVASCRAGTEIDHDATRTDGRRYCGFYTQAQIRQVVAYARRRYVTVVPEIEMPGHSAAALAAYPQLACVPGPFAVRQTWGVSRDIYCPTPATFTFLENVLTEVMHLFPGRYIHVGGDEVPKAQWRASRFVHALMQRKHLHSYDAVQGYFDRRIERFLEAHGRRMIGWDEILGAGVTRRAIIMSWRGEAGGIAAARRGNDVIMSPDGPLYFDAYQGDPNDEPDAIGGLSTLQMVYGYNPVPAVLTPAQAKHVIGVQGNLWTEYIPTQKHLFYMLLPRALALSEVAWSSARARNWDSFVARSGAQYAWLEAHHYAFRIPNPTITVAADPLTFANVSRSVRTIEARTPAASATVTLTDPAPGTLIYALGEKPSPGDYRTYSKPLVIPLAPGQRVVLRCRLRLAGGRTSGPSELRITRER